MALVSPSQHTAHYVHASLESFDRAAVNEITRRFEAVAGPGPHSLTYDENDHAFVLVCLGLDGAELDSRLGNIIRDYIVAESPGIKRFAECEIADPYDDYEVTLDDDSLSLNEPSLIVHLVNFDGMNVYRKAKAFRVRDLPLALQLRLRSRHDCTYLANAIALCRAGWDESSEEHFFDANTGCNLTELSSDQQADLDLLFELMTFADFTAKIPLPGHELEENEPRHWEFVGEPPPVDRWLEGMGEMKLIEPDAEPDITREALKFATGLPTQQNSFGRVRKPKGATLLKQPEPEADREPDQTEEQVNNNFAALLRSGADDDIDSEISDCSDDGPGLLQNFKRANKAACVKEDAMPISATEGTTSSSLTVTQRRVTAANTPATLSPPRTEINGRPNGELSSRSPSSGRDHSSGSYPSYTRSYAETDKFGLRGNVANHVTWENENAACLQSHQSTPSARTYEALALSRAEPIAISTSNGDDLGTKLATSKTPMTYKETVPGGDEPWANNIVPPIRIVPTGTLIDTSTPAPELDVSQFPQLGSSGQQPARRSHSNTRQLIDMSTTDPVKHDDENNLIELDDDIVERVCNQTENKQQPHVTMRQQAAKNKKQKKKAKVPGSKPAPFPPAKLELPSPPPPARARKETEQPANNGQGSSQPNTKKTPTIEEETSDRFQQEIEDLVLLALMTTEQHDVVVQFGLALMIDAEDLADHRALRHADLQEELDHLTVERRSTSFQTALGRRRKDGMHLLQLPKTMDTEVDSPLASDLTLVDAWTGDGKHAISDKRVYEITIEVAGGREWLLIFGQESPEDFEIQPLDSHQHTVYVHYPLRVWDARFQSKDPDWTCTGALELGSDLERDIQTFLQTLRTPKRNIPEQYSSSPPPMFEASIPDSAFLVKNVLAKRIMTQSLGSGTWVVTQVWDLHVQSKGSVVKAFGTGEESMVNTGRLWWEAALQHGGGGDLGGIVTEVVSRLDDVGFDGAALEAKAKAKKQKEKKPKEPEYQPFW